MQVARYALALACAFLLPMHDAVAGFYHPEALETLLDQVAGAQKVGEHPVVLFDLDDTLLDTSVRMAQLVRDFAAMKAALGVATNDVQRLASFGAYDVHWGAAASARLFGVSDPGLLAELDAWVMPQFLGPERCANDASLVGATAYLARLRAAGAMIVYLTGRDEPTMETCTLTSLRANGFPLSDDGATLIMKPDARTSDLAFKSAAFATVAAMGRVVAVFENEPANLNAMAAYFPAATAFFVDKRHSDLPDRPLPRAIWLDRFNR